jgi:hypothetical protein
MRTDAGYECATSDIMKESLKQREGLYSHAQHFASAAEPISPLSKHLNRPSARMATAAYY